VRVLEHPARAVLRRRLGVTLRGGADEIADGLPVELDGLERWGVGQRLLEARLDGVDFRTAALGEIARGMLPPGTLGKPVIDRLHPIVEGIVGEVTAVAAVGGAGGARSPAGAEPVDVRIALPGGRLLTGTVTGVRGDLLLTATFSRVAAKHRLAAWARLLALTATWPQRPLRAATVGRGSGADDVRVALIGPLAATAQERAVVARAELATLIDLYDRGMREPLPLYCQTSAAWALAAAEGRDPVQEAQREWETEWQFDREDRELEHQLVLGGISTLADLLDAAPRPGEDGDGWPAAEDTRLGRYARRLWAPLLEREELSAR
jgi:exodeoxyribonuclease V gamma subunit